MAQIANLTGHSSSATNYSTIAHDYMTQWQTLGFAPNASPAHAKLSYANAESDNSATWGLLYNLFADRELRLDLVPQSVYDTQNAFYETVFEQYGVPLDTRHGYTKNDWELFVAAVSSEELKGKFISTIAKWLGETRTNLAFTDLYDAASGE